MTSTQRAQAETLWTHHLATGCRVCALAAARPTTEREIGALCEIGSAIWTGQLERVRCVVVGRSCRFEVEVWPEDVAELRIAHSAGEIVLVLDGDARRWLGYALLSPAAASCS